MTDREPYDFELGHEDAGPSEQRASPRIKNHRRALLWPLLIVLPASLCTFLLTSILVIVVAAFLQTPGASFAKDIEFDEIIADLHHSFLTFGLSVGLPQFALIVPVLLASLLSPLGFRRRIGLVRGHWPLWGWIAGAIATPLLGMLSGLVVGLFMEESAALEEIGEIFSSFGAQGYLLPLALLIGVVPAICEEVLFRGYLQTRLTTRLPAWLGIGLASAAFAVFHFDPVHVVAVFPLGVWMGWLCYRSGSIFPAMLAHFVNNVSSVVATVWESDNETTLLQLPSLPTTLMVLFAGSLGILGVVFVVLRDTQTTGAGAMPADGAAEHVDHESLRG